VCAGFQINSWFPIFFPALLKYFGWSKAQLGLMSTAFSGGFLPSVVVAGWLLDRIEAHWVMGAGAIVVAGGSLLASHAGSFSMLFAANLILGVGLGASTFVPAALVIATWAGILDKVLAYMRTNVRTPKPAFSEEVMMSAHGHPQPGPDEEQPCVVNLLTCII
jgi:MFS family permease